MGLTSQPNQGDNGVHASASPFEGLAEKANWLGLKNLKSDPFGKSLLDAGLSARRIKAWFQDPQIKINAEGGSGSVFDALEEMDADECLQKLAELNKLN